MDENSGTESESDHDLVLLLNKEEWYAIRPDKGRNRLKLETGWTDLLAKKISEHNKTCVFVFTRNKVKKDNSRVTDAPFFNGKAACKFPGCISYSLMIEEEPCDEDVISISVKQTGVVNHEPGQVQKRHVTGERRKQIGGQVRLKGPSTVYYEKLGQISDEAYSSGNRNDAPSLNVLQKISSQLNKDEQLHEDILQECTTAKDIWFYEDNKSDKVKGYIQALSVYPFYMILFTEDQVQIFLEDDRKVLHLDATGTVVKKIPGQEKKNLYYAMVLPSVEKGEPPVPILEFVCNDHTVPSITYCLLRFKHAVTQLSNRVITPSRIEVDFSWALIQSVCDAFNCTNIRGYLIKSWNICRNVYSPAVLQEICVVHICAAHMMKFLLGNLKKRSITGRQKQIATFAFALMQNCCSIEDAYDIYEDICVVFSAQRQTLTYTEHFDSLNRRLQNISKENDFEENENEQQEDSEFDDQDFLMAEGIRKQSPFNTYFQDVKSRVKNILDDEGEDGTFANNELLCLEILTVFDSYMPLFPLWSGILLGDLCRFTTSSSTENQKLQQPEPEPVTRATNAEVENWFRIVKHNILMKKRHLRPGKFAMELHIGLKGRLREFQSSKTGKWNERRKKKKEKKNIDLTEEKWDKRKPKAKRKSKYYTPTKILEQSRKRDKTKEIGKTAEKDTTNLSEDDLPRLKVKRKKLAETQGEVKSTCSSDAYQRWTEHLRWGGTVETDTGGRITMVNTCPVDNFLMIFHCLLQSEPHIADWMKEHRSDIAISTILTVHYLFSLGRWSEGKALWLQLSGFHRSQPIWDAYGTETEMFVKHFANTQKTTRTSICSSAKCPDKEITNESSEILLSDVRNANNDEILELSFNEWLTGHTNACGHGNRKKKCSGERKTSERLFVNGVPKVLILPVSYLSLTRRLSLHDLDKLLFIREMRFSLFAVTISRRDHFVARIRQEKEWMEYDGLSRDAPKPSDTFKGTIEHCIFIAT